MSTKENLRPIIIKKKKVISGGGHHGGAWKVAMKCPS
jgi:chemotaxis protein MotB